MRAERGQMELAVRAALIAGIMTSLLGAVGLYGITAYSVSIRRRELWR